MWQANILVFGLLLLIVLGYSYWQTNQAKRRFLDHVRGQAPLIGEMIRLQADTAERSRDVLIEIVRNLLANTGRFIDYLDRVEPFTRTELEAFAAEAGLVGIAIIAGGRKLSEGPAGWLGQRVPDCGTQGLLHDIDRHVFILEVSRAELNGCVVIGHDASRIEELRETVAMPALLAAIARLPGIGYISQTKTPAPGHDERPSPEPVFIRKNGEHFAQVSFPVKGGAIVAGLRADRLFRHIRTMWRDFFLFNGLLASLGVLLSWLLYRQQTSHLEQVRSFERHMSHTREEAALGRAAAAIAHEVRNPLNAIAMGIQRLRIEAAELTEEHRRLLEVMGESVKRTDGIVGGLLRYARPPTPAPRPTRLDRIVGEALTLFREPCRDAGISVSHEVRFDEHIAADPDLIRQVVDNLLKNAVEAQPGGGFIRIEIDGSSNEALLSIRNGGFSMAPGEASRILEPYFTTKTRGTGLGLAISTRIIHAHGGRVDVDVPAKGELRIVVHLPKDGVRPGGGGGHEDTHR